MTHTELSRHWNAGLRYRNEGRDPDDYESCGGCGEPWPCRSDALVKALEKIANGRDIWAGSVARAALAAARGGTP